MTTQNPGLSSQIILPQPETDREKEVFAAIADRDVEIAERIEELDDMIGENAGVDLSAINLVGDPGFEGITDENLAASPVVRRWYQSLTADGEVKPSSTRHTGFVGAECFAPDVGDRSSIRQTVSASIPAGDYWLEFWTRGDGTNNGHYQVYQPSGGPIAATATGITGTTWTKVTAPFTAVNEALILIFWSPVGVASGASAWFDHVAILPATTYGNLDSVLAQIVRAIQLLAGDA